MNTAAAESPGARRARRQGVSVLLMPPWVFSRRHFPSHRPKNMRSSLIECFKMPTGLHV